MAAEARELGANANRRYSRMWRTRDRFTIWLGAAITEFGRVDILVNNAGMRQSKPFTEMTVEDWRDCERREHGRAIFRLPGRRSRHDRARLGHGSLMSPD